MKANYSKENLEFIVKESFSLAEVIRKLGLRDVGSNYVTVKKYIDKYDLNISHFTGQRWNKGKTKLTDERLYSVNIEDVFGNKIPIKSYNLKEKLFSLGYKEKKCEKCGCGTEWQGEPLTLELHHMDGNHYNNSLDNLQILCPNCHSQTETFRSRTKSNLKPNYEKIDEHRLETKICPVCGKEFHPSKKSSKYCCREHYLQDLNELKNINKIGKDVFIDLIKKYSTIGDISKELNLSRPTIRKYLEEYNLLNEFKSKYDFHSKEIIQYDLNGNFIKEWGSISDASETLKIYSISDCVNLKRKSAGGYIWRFK